ncbi:MAG: AbrB family transcriptional regulator, partial [Halomonas sp.]
YGLLFGLYAVSLALPTAALVAWAFELPFAAVLLALLPGGVGEMAVIAVAMGIDPLYVVTHHVLRMLLLIVLTPPLIGYLRRRRAAR